MINWQYRTPALMAVVILSFGVGAQQTPSQPQAGSQEQAVNKRPIRKDRVFVWDLEGTWISQAYIDQLKSSRSPRAAARRAAPLVIKVQKENRSYPILTTNFNKAVLHYLIEIEPDRKPGSYRMVSAPEDRAISSSEVTYIPFRGERGSDGKFETLTVNDPHFAKRKPVKVVRLPSELEPFVNRSVIAGKYRDGDGRTYEFTVDGDAITPQSRFPYEIVLDAKAASCDILQAHPEREPKSKERFGFAWKGQELRLFDLKATGKNRYVCGKQPVAVLTPEPSA